MISFHSFATSVQFLSLNKSARMAQYTPVTANYFTLAPVFADVILILWLFSNHCNSFVFLSPQKNSLPGRDTLKYT